MIPVSEQFQTTVRYPHTVVARVEVVRDDVVVRTLDVLSGSVEADRSGRILRRFNASVADPDGELTPGDIRDLLAPFGTILRMYRGVRIPQVTTSSAAYTDQPDWNNGTHDNTVATSGGDLQLG